MRGESSAVGEATATGVVYEVLFVKGSKVRRWKRLLREDEVELSLATFNLGSARSGIVAKAKPIEVKLTCLNGDFDGEW